MQISFKKNSKLQLKTVMPNKFKALSAREKIAIGGLLAAIFMALGMYLSAGDTDTVQVGPKKIVAQPVKKQPIENSTKPPQDDPGKNEVLGDTAFQENPFLPPLQYRRKPDNIQQPIESKAADIKVKPIESYKIMNNRQLPGQKAQGAARPVLMGIAHGAGQAKAVISYGGNSAAYAANDFVGSYQITSITSNAVILSGSVGSLVLTLKK